MKNIFLLQPFLLLLCFTISCGAHAEEARSPTAEKVLSMAVTLHILTSGDVKITEKITVFANQESIQRGIYRKLPKVRKVRGNLHHPINYTVHSVTRDGKREGYHQIDEGDSHVFYFGESTVYLDPGVYTYEFTYTVRRAINFFDSYDELYWNAIGQQWDFAIEQASVTVIYPDGATGLQSACYTGSIGSTKSDCTITSDKDSTEFKTKAVLSPYEGMTVAVGFSKGVIAPLGMWFYYKEVIIVGTLTVPYLLYLFITWWLWGRDLRRPPITPSFRPPKAWSAGLMAYCYRRNSDRVFACTLVSLAVKRAVTIRIKADEYAIELTNEPVNSLSDDENSLLEKIQQEGGLSLTGAPSKSVTRCSKHSIRYASKIFSLKKYFLKNVKCKTFAVLFAIATYAFSLFFFLDKEAFPIVAFSSVFCMLGLFSASVILGSSPDQQNQWLAIIFGAVFSIPLIICIEIDYLPSWITMLIAFFVVTLYLYFWLIERVDKKILPLLSTFEGLKLYLKTAEKDRFNTLNPPTKDLIFYEQLLPYSMALGVENQWTAQFSEVLLASQSMPNWIVNDTGRSTSTNFFKHFHRDLQRSMAASASYVKSSPSRSSSGSSFGSRSGSSGGGSSGGGSGGGGGGGW